MAAETVLVCECGCGQPEHHVGRKGCKHCKECTRFRAAEELPAAAGEPVGQAAEELASGGVVLGPVAEFLSGTGSGCMLDLARPDPGVPDRLREALDSNGELSKALFLQGQRLKRAETERDGLAAEAIRLRAGLADANVRAGERAEELTAARAELSAANARIRDLACEREQATQAMQAMADLKPADSIDALLDQADATGNPAIQHTSDTIRDLTTHLREQLADHARLDDLRAQKAGLEQQLADIVRQLADAEKPAAVVPDRTIRIWARENGHDVDARGRVPMELRALYLQANPA